MKSITNNTEQFNNTFLNKIKFGKRGDSDDVQIVNYIEKPEQGKIIISLYSQLFSGNQLNVFIRDNKIVLFITEVIKSDASETKYVSDWQNFYPRTYTRMRSVSLFLPGDNFFLMRYFLIPEEFMLKIILGQVTEN